LPSRPGEFHPEPLTDPDVNLSIHPARSRLPFLEAIAHSVRYARLAVKIDPENAEALAILARRTPWINRDYEHAVGLADRAVSINPNSAFVWIQTGFALMYSGQPERSLVHFERALRLNPRDPRAHDCLSGMAVALIQLARDTEAIAVANRAIQQNSNFTPAWRALSAALALSGHIDEARNAMSQVMELDPTCSISSMTHRVGYIEKARVRLFEGWRQAGMPD
jgi:adenylate cyclase